MSLGSWLLLLLVLGFAGGCAYNYFLQNKRGEEIVPGIGACWLIVGRPHLVSIIYVQCRMVVCSQNAKQIFFVVVFFVLPCACPRVRCMACMQVSAQIDAYVSIYRHCFCLNVFVHARVHQYACHILCVPAPSVWQDCKVWSRDKVMVLIIFCGSRVLQALRRHQLFRRCRVLMISFTFKYVCVQGMKIDERPSLAYHVLGWLVTPTCTRDLCSPWCTKCKMRVLSPVKVPDVLHTCSVFPHGKRYRRGLDEQRSTGMWVMSVVLSCLLLHWAFIHGTSAIVLVCDLHY